MTRCGCPARTSWVNGTVGSPSARRDWAPAGSITACVRSAWRSAPTTCCVRVQQRVAFGKPLPAQGVVQGWITDSRIRIEQARLLVLKAAWLMGTVGNRGAAVEISAIRVAVPEMATWVIDCAMQAHGGMGVSQATPLPELYAQARMLHLADGLDEVHKMALAGRELRRYPGA
jgi:acyl-CoA dehydrogenase